MTNTPQQMPSQTAKRHWRGALAACVSLMALMPAGSLADCQNAWTPSTPNQRFNPQGSWVEDLGTGLIWQRCPLGYTWRPGTGTGSCEDTGSSQWTWVEALQAAQRDNLGGWRWRLPNKQELASLVERRCSQPAINEALFPNTPSAFFWTSTPANFEDGYAWFQDFGRGESLPAPTERRLHIRLVREP